MNNKVRIILEVVSQPPFETHAMVEHKSIIVESAELAGLLATKGLGSSRVIAAVVEDEFHTHRSET